MDDMVSRQAAITAIQKAYADTEGGADKCAVWKNVGLTNALHIMQDLPSAQPERTDCTECAEYDHDRHYCQKYCDVIQRTLEESQPERKTGRWIYDEERCATGIYAICSACDESIYQTGNFRYCPNCGARMMEGENETD